MNCYKWELDAILEGLELKKVDSLEIIAVSLFNNRYVTNAKKPKLNKVFNKSRAENKVIQLYEKGPVKADSANKTTEEFLARQKALSLRLAGRRGTDEL